ncbi:MAG: outer membrane lipoprotein-sorting protein [Phycisphaerales bacterium]|nr:MAG: outer membrane lipoprotein-sorting protein [Phycisphaerales bacterium]
MTQKEKDIAMEYGSDNRPIRYLVMMAILGALLTGSAVGQRGAAEPNDLPADHPFVKDGQVDLEAVVKYFEDLYRSDSSISVAKLTITKPRRKRTLEMKIWTRGEEKALIVIRSPAREKGTATLKVDKNLWNYLPRIKRTIRIPPSMMLASWMGSDFTNDDLVKESSYSKDYHYELVGPSEQPKGWLVRFTAKPDIVGLWNRFELILSEDARVPIEAKYYDRKDRLSRVMHWSDVKVFDGRRIPARMTLTPADKEGHITEMEYLDIDFDVTVPDATFSLSNLEQRR